MFAATIAMTMTRADKGRIDFETNPAAKTTASDDFLHSRVYDKTGLLATY
jgi:hypothetical protein